MDRYNIEKAAIITIIVILAAALVAGAVMLVLKYTGEEPDDAGGGNTPATSTGLPDDSTAPPDITNTPDDSGTDEITGEVTDPVNTDPVPPDTDPEPEPVAVTKYDEPKTMYALSNVNARASNTTESIIIVMFYQGDAIKVTGETDNGWYIIEYHSTTAYIRGDLLTEDPSETEVKIELYTTSKTMYAKSEVNVRASFSTNSESFEIITPGTEVTVLGETANGWYQISYNDGVAYIKSDYLSNTKPEANTESPSDHES